MAEGTAYVRLVGNGVISPGPALVKGLLVMPVANDDWVKVYDGLDDTSGRLVLTVKFAAQSTQSLIIDSGVRFPAGVYIVAKSTSTETTVFFEPLD